MWETASKLKIPEKAEAVTSVAATMQQLWQEGRAG